MVVRVDIDPQAGFCFGVEKAIALAEKHLDEGDKVYGLGQMVHNDAESERLIQQGLETISVNDFPALNSGKVLLRAHGEPPSTYEKAEEHKIELIDATCPIVKKLQQKIHKTYLSMNPDKEQIVIFGKEGHPETIGLMGQTDNQAILITDPDDISPLEAGKKIYLYSQTTMDPDQYASLLAHIQEEHCLEEKSALESNCTICGQMKKRKPELKKFARNYDTLIFLSGRESSNGRMLFEFCKQQNSKTYWIHTTADIDPLWCSQTDSIGISGATSTPSWQLNQVREYILDLIREKNII